MKPILAFILLACLSACSSGNGQPDAGLDAQDGNTHVVWVDAPDFMGNAGYVIQMDANFNEVGRDEITDWQQN